MTRKTMIAAAAVAALGGIATLSGISSAQAPSFAQSCEAMNGRQISAAEIGLPTRGATITAARLMPAVSAAPAPIAAPPQTPTPTPAAPVGAAGRAGGPPGGGRGPAAPNPEYCRIEASIHPLDANAPPINMALAVPAVWNGNSWQMGGSGNNGVIPNLIGAGAGNNEPGSPSLLTQGYAVYGSDSGHQGNAMGWIETPEAWTNFAYQQLKKTNDTAQGLLRAMHGRKARVRYFSGGSQGGREALEVVARYPADYEGVYSHVPLAYFQGLMIDPTLKVKAQAEPGAWIQPAKYPAINSALMAVCDDLDGLVDGVIGNYVACVRQVDPSLNPSALSALRCPGGGEGEACLSTAQHRTLISLFAPVKYPFTLPNGQPDWPGWGPGAQQGLLASTRPDPVNPNGPFGIGAPMQRQLFGKSDSYNLYNFEPGQHVAKLQQMSRDLDVPADWSAFFRRGGKLIMVSAAADPIANPRAQMRLYDNVVRRSGQASVDRSVRFYVVPMGDHSGTSRSANGEVMPSGWGPTGALRDWVEHGVTPADAPVLASAAGGQITATRPMCRYPAYPHYVGGDRNRASAFSCRKP